MGKILWVSVLGWEQSQDGCLFGKFSLGMLQSVSELASAGSVKTEWIITSPGEVLV